MGGQWSFYLAIYIFKSYSIEKLVTLFFIVEGGEAKNDKRNHYPRGSLCQGSWKLGPSTEQIRMK